MNTTEENNKNLGDKSAENIAERTNMPDNQVPRFRSNENSVDNKVQSDAGFLSREVGEGDFGSEEARADAEKGNEGEAGNMPYSTDKSTFQAKDEFLANLQQQYAEIVDAEWKTSETLELILSDRSETDDFANRLKEEVVAKIGFTDHVDLVVRKENDQYFAVIEINNHSLSEN